MNLKIPLKTTKNIINSLSDFNYILDEKQKRDKKLICKLQEQLKEVQTKCNHKNNTYHVDPAGDFSENYFECRDCGKTW